MTCTIKICGITNQEDLEMIAREGADYGGVIAGIPQSPRNLSLDTAKTLCSQTPLPLAALTFNKSVAENVLFAESLSPFALQLQGEETPDEVAALREQVSCEIWKALHLPPQEEGQPVDLSAYLARAHAFIAAGVDRFIIDTCTILDGVKRYGGTGKPV
ncbi:MAG: phosphoribosylanthranilate isomerase, partial [bacterium]|nr:phosphoribosylanthranilate isomerase [bacterium]